MTRKQTPPQVNEGFYVPPMDVATDAERRQFRHGGNRPPFRARLVSACGHVVELIPVLTLYTAGHPQHWQCYLPPGALPCLPFELAVDADPGRENDLAVSVAVAANERTGEVQVWPAQPRHHTPN